MDQNKALKIGTVVLGIIVIGIGCHAYFESPFNKQNKDSDFHKVCKEGAEAADKTCPPYSYESYFIAIIFIAFIVSLLLLVASFLITNDLLKRADAPYHIIVGVLLFIGGILVIVSASQIWSLFKESGFRRNDLDYFDEKIAAGAICMINALLYLVIGVFSFKNRNN